MEVPMLKHVVESQKKTIFIIIKEKQLGSLFAFFVFQWASWNKTV